MNMHLGAFHDVVGFAVGVSCISILNEAGVEQLIRVQGRFNQKNAEFDPIQVSGEFGDFSKVKSGHRLEGIEPRDITEIDVSVNYVDDNFHTKLLSLKSAAGMNLTWELYCDGNSTET
jgi:hypothetical protein